MQHELLTVSLYDFRNSEVIYYMFLDQKKMDSVTKLFISFGLVVKPTISVGDNQAIGQK